MDHILGSTPLRPRTVPGGNGSGGESSNPVALSSCLQSSGIFGLCGMEKGSGHMCRCGRVSRTDRRSLNSPQSQRLRLELLPGPECPVILMASTEERWGDESRNPWCPPCHGRVSDSLSTLRSADYSNTTQDSIPVAGQALLDGLSTRMVPLKGFRVVDYISFSFPKLAWRKGRGRCREISPPVGSTLTRHDMLLTAVQDCGAGGVSRRSYFAAHRCAALENRDDSGLGHYLSQIRKEAQECTLTWSFGPRSVAVC